MVQNLLVITPASIYYCRTQNFIVHVLLTDNREIKWQSGYWSCLYQTTQRGQMYGVKYFMSVHTLDWYIIALLKLEGKQKYWKKYYASLSWHHKSRSKLEDSNDGDNFVFIKTFRWLFHIPSRCYSYMNYLFKSALKEKREERFIVL